jgi:hypothetical protein
MNSHQFRNSWNLRRAVAAYFKGLCHVNSVEPK